MEVEFDPQMTRYDENKLWSEILKNIVAWLDGLYMKQFDHRIRSGYVISSSGFFTQFQNLIYSCFQKQLPTLLWSF